MQPAGTPFFSARESWLQALPGDVGGASQGPLSLVTQVRPSIASAIQSSLLNGIRRLLVGIKSVEKPFWIEVLFRFDLPGVIFTGPCQAWECPPPQQCLRQCGLLVDHSRPCGRRSSQSGKSSCPTIA